MFQQIISEKLIEQDSDERAKKRDLRRKLAEIDQQAGTEVLQTLLAEALAKVLQLPAARLDVHQDIMRLGG